MTNRTLTGTVLLMLTSVAYGCRDARGPVTPGTPVGNPPPTTGPRTPPATLSGSVYDTAFRPLGGVRIEVVDGPSAGVSTTSGVTGSFALTGIFPESVTFRASKAGYVTALATQNVCRCNYISFTLDVPRAPVAIAGDYILTLSADPSCADLPEDVRERSYPVTVVPTSELHGFSITLNDPPFLGTYKWLWIGVSGDFVSIYFGGDYGSLAERLAPNTYAHFDAFASATVDDPVTTISAPLQGVVERCELKPGVSFTYACPTNADAISRVSCKSANHRFTLKRR